MFGVGCVYVFAIIGRKNTPLNNQYLTSTLIKFEDLQWIEKKQCKNLSILVWSSLLSFCGSVFWIL